MVPITISAKDVLLEVASGSSDSRDTLAKANASSTQQYLNRLLIIDDLDVLLGETDEGDSSPATTTNLESEQLRALNAVIKLIDNAINDASYNCFVLGISRTSWSQLPSQLARVGRFEKVVTMPAPTLGQRKDIFKYWLSTLPLHDTSKQTVTQWIDLLAPRTAGCVASDIRRICAEALTSAVARSQSQQGALCTEVEWEDLKEAARACVPSQLSALDVIPASLGELHGNCTQTIDSKIEFQLAWKDFGGYDEMKKRLYRTIVRPWKYHIIENASITNDAATSSVDKYLEILRPSGVLFHGPSGNGKTLACLCLASSLGLHCVKVRASDVFNQWLGGSEATLRSIFARARAASPCILFFDELDALAMNREAEDASATSGVQSRILTTLLNEMDGITNAGGKQDVLVVAATNRLDAIDAALLRPGRLEEHVLLNHPDAPSIKEMLKIQTAKMPLDDSVCLARWSDLLASASTTCAEVEGVCRDACLVAMRRCSEEGDLDKLVVTDSDFDVSFNRIKKSPTTLS